LKFSVKSLEFPTHSSDLNLNLNLVLNLVLRRIAPPILVLRRAAPLVLNLKTIRPGTKYVPGRTRSPL
jgi:hypothetical protein